MAWVDVDETYTGEGVELFDRLRLETDEVARFFIPVKKLYSEHVHTIRGPVMEHGVPVMRDKERKDGTVYGQDYKTHFIGQRICLGDPDVLADKGLDPDRCPACKAAAAGLRDARPERRYAVPIVRYDTKSRRSSELRNPPGGKILVWTLTQRMYGQLAACKRQMRELLDLDADAPLPLSACDVVLTCESGDFQRMRWDPPKRPARKHPKVAPVIGELWGDEDNRPSQEQLRAACGRDNGVEYMQEDIDTALREWAEAERAERDGPQPDGDPTGGTPLGGEGLGDGLDELLDEGAPAGTTEDELFGEPGSDGDELDPDNPGVGGTEEFAPREQHANGSGAAKPADDDADPFGEESEPAQPTAPAKTASSAKGAGKASQAAARRSKPAAGKEPAAAAAAADAAKSDFDDVLGDLG
jgi:hypothetical protein